MKSVAIWSLRLRPARSLPPRSAPTCATRAPSSAPCTSSSCGPGSSSPARTRRSSSSMPASSPSRSASVSRPGRVQHPGVRPGPVEVVGRQPPVEVRAARERLELGAGTAGEPAAPEAARVGRARLRSSAHAGQCVSPGRARPRGPGCRARPAARRSRRGRPAPAATPARRPPGRGRRATSSAIRPSSQPRTGATSRAVGSAQATPRSRVSMEIRVRRASRSSRCSAPSWRRGVHDLEPQVLLRPGQRLQQARVAVGDREDLLHQRAVAVEEVRHPPGRQAALPGDVLHPVDHRVVALGPDQRDLVGHAGPDAGRQVGQGRVHGVRGHHPVRRVLPARDRDQSRLGTADGVLARQRRRGLALPRQQRPQPGVDAVDVGVRQRRGQHRVDLVEEVVDVGPVRGRVGPVQLPVGVGGADDPVGAPRDHEEHRRLRAQDQARRRS